ncbi:MAG TPA: hypothetical protein VF487_06105 [Chitinophagaceae bacterium]
MSKQQLSSLARQAIWLSHGKKCAYTGELLTIGNMQIDHIIPEKVADDPKALELTKSELRLPADFNPYGFENLLPVVQRANLQKGTILFDEGRIHYFLGIAAAKKSEIERRIEELKKQIDKTKGSLFVQSLLENQKISAEEVAEILEQFRDEPKEGFNLLMALGFFDKEEVSRIEKSDIESLRRSPIKLGPNEDIYGVDLRHNSRPSVFVRTCVEYDAAVKNGYYAATTFDMKMAAFFAHQCGLLSALTSAEIPETSFISDLNVGIHDLHLLPFSIFPSMTNNEEISNSKETYSDKINQGVLHIKTTRSNLLQVESRAMGQQLIEVARADFNGDGIEDILLFEYSYAVSGTYGSGNIILLTRKGKECRFESIPQDFNYQT